MRGKKATRSDGFTLFEIAVVLVVIGLLAGGVLIGRNLIEAARIQQQVSQINGYNTAITLFQAKYNTLPGDMTGTEADDYGFAARSGAQGHGDNDKFLESCGGNVSTGALGCETALFWRDLSQAKFIDESFATATDGLAISLTPDTLPLYLPLAVIQTSNYITVASQQATQLGFWEAPYHWFFITGMTSTTVAGNYAQQPKLTPVQTYGIDQKIDDGLPFTGTVQFTTPFGMGLTSRVPENTQCSLLLATNKYNLASDYEDAFLCGVAIRIQSWPAPPNN